jgi:hypothetical protein
VANKTILIAAAVVVAIGVVAYVGFSGSSAVNDGAGTIVEAKRAMSDGASGPPTTADDRSADNGAANQGDPNGARDNGARDNGARDNGARDNGARDNGARDNGARDNGARDNASSN